MSNLIPTTTQASVDAGGRELSRDVIQPPTRASLGGLLFVENFRHPRVTMFNDGSGSATRDNSITFTNGNPTLRIDPQGSINGSGSPSTGPVTTGVIVKRRISNLIKGTYAWEGWIRWTSQNNTSNVYTTVSNYNRSGTNAYYSRIWLDTTTGATGAGNPDGTGLPYINLLYLNSSGVWTQFGTYNQRVADHQWDPINNPGKGDSAGMWHYFRLVTDFSGQKYVSLQFNDVLWNASTFSAPINGGATQQAILGGQTFYSASDTGARVMHFSIEFSASTSSRRFISAAQLSAEQLA